jgi:short subunit dehydrogenase-like uncharacterized protein
VKPWQRWALRILYWLAVLAVSIVLLVVLITLIESRDKSSVKGGVVTPAWTIGP